jgi:ABC-type ATPase involved in cell division
MEMLNLDHLVSIKKSSYNDIEIDSFNLIEGDWVYISGDTSIADLIYELLTVQIKVTSGEMKIFGYDSNELSQEQLLEIRQSISCLPNDLSSPETDKSIINNLSLLKALKVSESSKILNQLKSELFYNEDLIETKEVKNILKAISTKPKVLFIDFSFDKFENSRIIELLDPLYKYLSKTGLAIVFCTNNAFIKTRYKSRVYNADATSLKV